MKETPAKLQTAEIPIAYRWARASWQCPVLGAAMTIFGRVFGVQPVALDLAALGLAVAGLGLGAAALLKQRRHGRWRILVPAAIGTALSALLAGVWIWNAVAAFWRARG
jgi:hypothetical protein